MYIDIYYLSLLCIGICGFVTGKPVACNFGLLSVVFDSRWGIVACCFGPLSFSGRFLKGLLQELTWLLEPKAARAPKPLSNTASCPSHCYMIPGNLDKSPLTNWAAVKELKLRFRIMHIQ